MFKVGDIITDRNRPIPSKVTILEIVNNSYRVTSGSRIFTLSIVITNLMYELDIKELLIKICDGKI